MLRASAKNFKDVLSVTDPARLPARVVEARMAASSSRRGSISPKRPFARVPVTKKAIASFLARLSAEADKLSIETEEDEKDSSFPSRLVMSFDKVQRPALRREPAPGRGVYRDADPRAIAVAGARQLHGKELSYNNILDLDAACVSPASFLQIAPRPSSSNTRTPRAPPSAIRLSRPM